MIRIAVCDKNSEDRDSVLRIVKDYIEFIGAEYAVCSFSSQESLIKDDRKFDIIFMDINIEEPMSGILAGKLIKNYSRETKIIYTTEFSDYMEMALNEVHAYAYLSKPVKSDDIIRQLSAAVREMQEALKEKRKVIFNIINIIDGEKIGAVTKAFNVDEILYFESIERKIMIKTYLNEFYFIDSISNVFEKIKKYDFARCHQSILVNMSHVKGIRGYEVLLDSEDILPIAQKRSKEFRQNYNTYKENC